MMWLVVLRLNILVQTQHSLHWVRKTMLPSFWLVHMVISFFKERVVALPSGKLLANHATPSNYTPVDKLHIQLSTDGRIMV